MTAPSEPAISAYSFTCWQLLYPNGVEVDSGDGIPHFDTEREALEATPGYAIDGGFGTPAPQILASPCFVVRARCGYLLDEEGSMVMHHGSAEEAAKSAEAYGWKLLPSGEYRCSDDCDDCGDAE